MKKAFIVKDSNGPAEGGYVAQFNLISSKPGTLDVMAAFTKCSMCALPFKSEEEARMLSDFLNLQKQNDKQIHECVVVELDPTDEELARHLPAKAFTEA